MPRVATLAAILLLAAACSSGNVSSPQPTQTEAAPFELWPLPDDPMGLARKAGLEPLASESLAYHVHAHLDVFQDGRRVIVPGGIGIDITDPAVKRFDEDPLGASWGGITTPCADACISPLHTHDPDGVIHTESPTPTPNTFGQFLIEWDVELPAGTKVYVDGREYTDDIAGIELADGREIAVIIGTPPNVIPSEFPAGLR
jgi:hypothetical protein